MRRFLAATLAAVLVMPTAANAAELLKNLQVSGELDVDAVSANNVTDFLTKTYDGLSSVQTRLMLHGDWDVNDDVHARVSVDKNNRTWGAASENLNGVQTALLLDEANVKIKQLFGALDTTVGRQYYGEKGDAVIYFGPKDDLYGLPVTALDAARFDWSGPVGVTVLGAKVAGTGLTPPDTGATNLYGVNVSAKSGDNLSGSLYLYDRDIVNSQGVAGGRVLPDDILYVLGVRAKMTAGGAWVKVELDKDFGQNRPLTAAPVVLAQPQQNYTGWAFLADAGVKTDVSSVGTLQGLLSLAVGSGGSSSAHWFTPVASDYRPGAIWGRFFAPNGGGVLQGPGNNIGDMASTGSSGSIGGLDIISVGAKLTPAAASKLTVGVSAHQYRWHDADAANLAATGFGPPGLSNTLIGNEYDADLNWQQNENTSVTVGAGTFQPGNWVKAVTTPAGNSPSTVAFADLRVKFGGSSN